MGNALVSNGSGGLEFHLEDGNVTGIFPATRTGHPVFDLSVCMV